MTITAKQPAPDINKGGTPPSGRGGNAVTRFLMSHVRQSGMVVALIAILLLFQVWTGGIVLKPLNVTNIIQQNGYILVLAIGMVIVIINGHIDLSVGSVAAFTGAMAGVLMVRNDMPWLLAVLLCIGMGALIGAWQASGSLRGGDSVVHRDARRHAGVPRRHPVRARRTIDRADAPAGWSRSAVAFCPNSAMPRSTTGRR